MGLIVVSSVSAGEIVLVGKYRGKDIYVQNPYNADKDSYCTSAVYVNDRQVQDYPTASAFTIDLSYLAMGDLVVLRIEHNNECVPKVVNPQVLKEGEGFEFMLEQVGNNSISWNTKGELPDGKFMVEQMDSTKLKWNVIKEMAGKGGDETNQYSIAPTHFEGENQYRIKYTDHEGAEFSSLKLMYTYTDNPVQFSPKTQVTSKIKLSRSIPYTITDMDGNLVKEGNGKVIMVQDLKRGLYFLNIQNRSERFIKQ
jgi:hypothetical protein